MAMLFSVMSFAAEVTVKISDYATANGWKDATQYKTLKMDDNVSITVAGGSNTGKYYTNGNNWRMYQNESPKITLTATNGNLLKTVKFTYTVNNTGILVDASKAQVKSGTVYTFADEVTTYTFGVGNTGTAANGQVRFSEITVVYDVPTPSNPDAVKYTVTAKVNDPAMGTVTGAGEYEEGKTATLTANANTGYKFVNWSTGSTDNPLKITVTENVELTANFEAIPQMTCAEAAAAASGATVVLNPFDVVYVVKGAGYTYIKDDSGVNLIFDYTMDDQFKAGDHVEGFVGVSSPYNGLPEIKPTVAFADLKVTPGTAPEATVFETVPTKEDVNKYVVFKGVKLTSNISYNTSSATNATISVGGKNVTLRNNFKLAASLTSGSTYDIYAFVAIYNGNIQMYYASSVDVSPERTITATVNPAETGTVTGAGTYKEGKTATLKATPAEGYEFTCWTEGEDTVSTAANYSFKVAADRALVANFKKAITTITKTFDITQEEDTRKMGGTYVIYADDDYTLRIYGYNGAGTYQDDPTTEEDAAPMLFTPDYDDALNAVVVVTLDNENNKEVMQVTATSEDGSTIYNLTINIALPSYETYSLVATGIKAENGEVEGMPIISLKGEGLQNGEEKVPFDFMVFESAVGYMAEGTIGDVYVFSTMAEFFVENGEFNFMATMQDEESKYLFNVDINGTMAQPEVEIVVKEEVNVTLYNLTVDVQGTMATVSAGTEELSFWLTLLQTENHYGDYTNDAFSHIWYGDEQLYAAYGDTHVYAEVDGKAKFVVSFISTPDAEGNVTKYNFALYAGEKPSDPTALDNLNTTVAPVKMIENGQLIIINNGVQYNAQGQVIK